MANDKRKVVRYTGPLSKQRGNIQYWDGSNWISLANGAAGTLLTTHGVDNPPTWEEPPEPPVVLPSVDFTQAIGLNSQVNSTAREEVHLVIQPKGAATTKDREGNQYENIEGPFAAPWNWDDNESGDEVLYFGFEDPLTNKYIGVSYKQTQYSTFGYYISEIRVKSYEVSGGNTGASILSGGPKQFTIEGDGVFDVPCDSSGNVTESIVGVSLTSSSSSSSITSINFTLPPPDQPFPMTPNPPNKLTIDIGIMTLEISRFPSSFNSYSMNLVPKPSYMQEAIYNGGKIGGLWYGIMKGIEKYEDNGGYVSQAGVPVPMLNSSSSNVKIGCWGWYGSESSSSSAPLEVDPHFIPINRISDDYNIDIGEFLATISKSRLDYEGVDAVEDVASYVSTISFFEVNVIATIWNLMQDSNSKGYWKLENWCDPSLRINGETICCNNDEPVPSMIISVTGDDVDLPVTWSGITWEKSTTPITNSNQKHSGQTASICATSYTLHRTTSTTTATYTPKIQKWYKYAHTWNASGIGLGRAYYVWRFTTEATYRVFGRLNSLNINGQADNMSFLGSGTNRPIPVISQFSSFNLNHFTSNNPATPTEDSYQLNDAFFGFETIGNLVYSWSKGSMWP